MTVREMTLEDLDQVMAIERENFSVPWTENGFFSFLIRAGYPVPGGGGRWGDRRLLRGCPGAG